MKEGWKETNFGNFVDCNPKISIKKGQVVENCEMEDINPDYKFLYPREGKLYNGSNSKFQNGDTVFARITPCLENGKIAQIKDLKTEAAIGSTEFFVFRGKSQVSDNEFIYYLSKSNLVRDTAVNSMTGASGRQRADLKALKKLKIKVPSSVKHQQRIASILYAYDDLIEVNNKRIELLEQSARELYKEWFVRMRFPNYQNTKFNKGIPEGWEIVRIDNLYNTSAGGTPKSDVNSYYENGNINFVKTGDLNDSFIQDTPTKITELGLKNSSAKIFPSYTVIFAMYGNTIGKMGVLAKEAAMNQACCAITPKTKIYNWEYIFYSLYIFREQLTSLGMGAAQQNINQDEIKKFKIYKPEEELIERFNKIVSLNFNQIENLQKQNQQLTEIRNRLLPRLISGKLEVKA